MSVSTPAVKDTVKYARKLREEYPELEIVIDIVFLNGESSHLRYDLGDVNRKIIDADLIIADFMGANEGFVSSVTMSLKRTGASKIIINRLGPVSSKLGDLNPDLDSYDETDARNVDLFSEYYRHCEGDDMASAYNMILKQYFGCQSLPDPVPLDECLGVFLKNPVTGRILFNFEEYIEEYPFDGSKRNILLFFSGRNYPFETTPVVKEVYSRLSEFANVLPLAFNQFDASKMDSLMRLIGVRIDLVLNLQPWRFIVGPMGKDSSAAESMLMELNAPYIRSYYLSKISRAEWEESTGVNVMDFMVNIFMPEMDGAICTFPIATTEEVEFIEEYGFSISEIRAIPERVERLNEKIKGLIKLRTTPNSQKKVAIVGYNYPVGEGNLFGGAFLDTFSSLEAIAHELRSNGYSIDEFTREELKREFLDNGILNDGDWTIPNREKLIRFKGSSEHPMAMIEQWGQPPGNVLADKDGYIIPGVIHGNLFIGLQPPRSLATGEEASKEYHDPYKPPHHQYIAFYEWLRDEFEADAVIHIGTHGTVEFLPGKEAGMSGQCYPDLALGGVPHFYLYFMGNPSEAMLAKRRTHADLITYMTPPYVKSGLYGELSELQDLIAEYRESSLVDKGRSQNVLELIVKKANDMRLPTDIDDLEHELDDMRRSLIPYGFHIIGQSFTNEEAETSAIQAMRFPHSGCLPLEEILCNVRGTGDYEDEAEAIYRAYNSNGTIPDDLIGDEDALKSLEFEKETSIRERDCYELKHIVSLLDGHYTPVRPGGDLLRYPETIPTGFNMVQFDPSKIPTEVAFKRGAEVAENTIRMYREDNDGQYPESIAMVMWGLETSRSQGATIGQILDYLGIRQIKTSGPFQKRFEIIPLEELGRPRIDITVSICGFFRDMFGSVIDGLNKIFEMINNLDEPDGLNLFKKHTKDNYEKLIADGRTEEEAADLSLCRLFGPGEGLYGTGMTRVVNEGSWEEEKELADIFENRMKFAYSAKARGKDAGNLMTYNHRNVSIVSQIRDNIEYELIDLDHFYEYFGGLSKTVELARGSKAVMYITDNSGPKVKTQDVRTSIEHGVRTRLLNPVWMKGMLETDYHGVQKINERFENVLGLAATTGAVDSAVFSDMLDCYVRDEELRKSLEDNNEYAYMDMLNRLLEANQRNYWTATEEELDVIKKAFLECEELAERDSDRGSRDRRRMRESRVFALKISIEHMDFAYNPEVPVLKNVNLEMEGPKFISILGPNGVGKSTLIHCINKILTPTGGEVFIDGRNVKEISIKEMAKNVGYVPYSANLTFPMSVLDTVLMGRHPFSTWRSADEDLDKVYDVLDLLGITDLAMRSFNELSAGQHQKVMLAKGLVQEPKALLLDEPTSNLDIKHQLEVTKLLKRLSVDQEMLIVMISHDINIAAKFSDEIVLMNEGTVFSVGRPEEVMTVNNIRDVYGVISRIVDDGVPHIILEDSIVESEG